MEEIKEKSREVYLKSLVFLQLGDYKRVVKTLTNVSKKDSYYVDAMLTKAEACKRMFKRDKAVKLIKKAFELNPNNPLALTRLAEITMRPKDKKANLKAIELLDKALKKERIVNELEELLKNPNIPIRTEGIKDIFIKFRPMCQGKMELEWYRIAEHFIEVLKTKIE